MSESLAPIRQFGTGYNITWSDKVIEYSNKHALLLGNLSSPKLPGVGVVVGRWQTNLLHAGHLALIKEADKHANLIIFVGCARFPLTKKNPLDFATRKQMLQTCFPHAIILPLYDQASDAVWSEKLDQTVTSMFPFDQVTLYGSRDSFFPYYHGKFNKIEVKEVPGQAATSTRELLAAAPMNDPAFRAGVIYASHHMFPRVQPTVDVFIWRKRGKVYEVLLGRKENSTSWCLIGGFVDHSDRTMFMACTREVREEAGLHINPTLLEYVSSLTVGDWRASSDCSVLTSLFSLKYLSNYGVPKAGDDIKEVKWFSFQRAVKVIAVPHYPLLDWGMKKVKDKK